MIVVTDAGFRYGQRDVLGPVTVRIGPGELVFVVGPNGAGKTTLLRLIAGLCAPSRGQVRCFDTDPFTTPRHEIARRLAFLPQSYELAFPFTVGEVVLLGRYAHGRRGLAGFFTREDDRALAREAMERCDVLELAERRWNELSGGEQRRGLLAQAFCQDAELLLLDEPTASLDPAHAIAVCDTVAARKADGGARSTIVVSHDLNLAARYADRVLLIDEGALVADGTPTDVLASDAARKAFAIELHLGVVPGTSTPFVVPDARGRGS